MAAAKKATEKETPETQVAKRSADGSDGTRHAKEFVVLGGQFGETDGPEHEPNKLATLQEAIQRGLHPRGDVSFDGTDLTGDGVSRSLRYSVEVVPSAMDSEPEKTTTPRKQIDEG
ncbi:hypothetical protein [Streptomyces sp. NRRL B-24720]|uniref:hypothetical protein n=1 Tax=Streptomyces sp. NRRL B-24720 TaxID=1476876 RepID=UPI0004CAD3B1|nr:hypothetical protein [Streptomyces sp. NRRL B-24720]